MAATIVFRVEGWRASQRTDLGVASLISKTLPADDGSVQSRYCVTRGLRLVTAVILWAILNSSIGGGNVTIFLHRSWY